MSELRRLFDDVIAIFDDLLTQYDGLYEEILEGQGGPGFPLQPLPVKKPFKQTFNIDGTFFKKFLNFYTIIGIVTRTINYFTELFGIKKFGFIENLMLRATVNASLFITKILAGNQLVPFNFSGMLNGTTKFELEKQELIEGIKKIQTINNHLFVGVIQYSNEAIFQLEAHKIISSDVELGVYGKRIEKFYKGAEITGKRNRKNILLALDLLQ